MQKHRTLRVLILLTSLPGKSDNVLLIYWMQLGEHEAEAII